MKNIKLFLPLVCLFIFSCQKEQLNELNENNINLSQTSPKNTAIADINNKTSTDTNLENRMQWVSYITASVLYHEEDARINFLNTIANNETIVLNNLLGNNVSSIFKTKFLNFLYLYSSPEYPEGNLFSACPEGSEDDPIWPPYTGEKNSNIPTKGGIDPTQNAVDGFMNYILNENCIELYFPNQLLINSQESFRITSTAHPLTNTLENEAYLRYRNEEILEQNCTAVEEFSITPNHIMHPSFNVIVARPYTTNTCEYTEYSGIDFTEFLRN